MYVNESGRDLAPSVWLIIKANVNLNHSNLFGGYLFFLKNVKNAIGIRIWGRFNGVLFDFFSRDRPYRSSIIQQTRYIETK